jgi:hypothetical protein
MKKMRKVMILERKKRKKLHFNQKERKLKGRRNIQYKNQVMKRL